MKPRLSLASAIAAAVLLAACASNQPAPVVQRTPPVVVEAPAGAPTVAASTAQAGYYTVKKGDTLYGIALDHGLDYKDLAVWNSLDNPNLIKVGQQLRVTPPEGAAVAVTRPVTIPAAPEVRPLSGGDNTEALKRSPRGGKQPYSDQAWAQMQRPEGVALPVAVSAPAQEPAKPPQEAPKPAPLPVVPAGGETVEWAWPSAGKLIGNFADGSNKGIDLSGKAGQPVMAAASGKVTLVSSALRGYGNLVVVKHGSDFLSVYAHNSKVLVKEGQSVNRGEQIAEIGSTDADQPKLHFEIRRQGKPVDPLLYLPKQ